MTNGSEPVPNDLKASLIYAGINPERVTEWELVGDSYNVKLEPRADLANVTVVNRTSIDSNT